MYKHLQYVALLDNDSPKNADAIVLLTGDGHTRVEQTISLFQKKFSNIIVVSGGLDNPAKGSLLASVLAESLKARGIPEQSIITDNESQNTYQQAQVIIKMAKKNNWHKIILVATHYHQYRAFLTFLKVRNDLGCNIEIFNAPARYASWFENTPWGRRINLLGEELEKIIEYQSKGHVASFEDGIKYFEQKENT